MTKYEPIKVTPEDVEQLLRQGNLPQAEMYCRMVLEQDPTDPTALYFLGWIAEKLKLREHALSYYAESRQAAPGWQLPRQRLELVEQQAPAIDVTTAQRYLLIKAWGFGFWADVYHVVGQLLVAEITNRTPIVNWGPNSLFTDGSERNAWELYFDPVSSLSVSDLENSDYDIFPEKWTPQNLHEEDLNKWQGPGSRMAALYFLNRPERAVVSDFYTPVLNLKPWIPASHPLHGLSVDELCQHLIRKHIHPKQHIIDRVDDFCRDRLRSANYVSVHVRGTDKVKEMSTLENANKQYFDTVDKLLSTRKDFGIFLLTDDQRIVSTFSERYGNAVITTDCQRGDDATGIHYRRDADRRQLGIEAMVDAYIAARGQAFIGNGFSNFSTMVGHLKEWADDDIYLFGESVHHCFNTMLHDWKLFRHVREGPQTT
jgi:protein O-GlcNAc transferase